jgi:hypothetical protein
VNLGAGQGQAGYRTYAHSGGEESGEPYIAIYSYICMIYGREEKLILGKKVYITEDVYNILREQKKKQKLSLAKIVCNAIIQKYGVR